MLNGIRSHPFGNPLEGPGRCMILEQETFTFNNRGECRVQISDMSFSVEIQFNGSKFNMFFYQHGTRAEELADPFQKESTICQLNDILFDLFKAQYLSRTKLYMWLISSIIWSKIILSQKMTKSAGQDSYMSLGNIYEDMIPSK